MKTVVKLFAGARELAGKEEVSLELPSGATIGDLREQLIADHAEIRSLLGHALFAINAEYCDNATLVPADSEIACIPPVSGG